jgi:hypothetical protein
MDPLARKQLLLTRVALDRVELRFDMNRVRQAVSVPLLLRALVGADLSRTLFSGGKTGGADWLRVALTLLRRYRLAATIFGGIVPLLRARRSWRRVALLGAVGVAAWFGWRAVRGRRGAP